MIGFFIDGADGFLENFLVAVKARMFANNRGVGDESFGFFKNALSSAGGNSGVDDDKFWFNFFDGF